MSTTPGTDTVSVPLTQEMLDQCLNCPSNSAIVVPLSSLWNSGDVGVAYSLDDVVGNRPKLTTTVIIDSSPAVASSDLSRAEDATVTYGIGCSTGVDSGEHRALIASRRAKPKALSTAPAVVELRQHRGRLCAFARGHLPAHCRFGPFDAPFTDHPSLNRSIFILAVPSSSGQMQYLNLDDDSTADWMKFVRPTREKRLQNLKVVYTNGKGVFFDATRAIETNEELRVWYSDEYEQMLRSAGALNERSYWLVCFDCDVRFDTSAAYEQHLQLEHDSVLPDDYSDDDSDDPAFSLRDRSLNKDRTDYLITPRYRRFRLNMSNIPIGKLILLRYLKWLRSRGLPRYTFERRFYCKPCRMKLYSAKENANHMLKHELYGEAAHVCQFCGRRYFILQTLKAHSMSAHMMDKIFPCGMCSSTFSREVLLEIHARSHVTASEWSAPSGEEDLTCPAIGCNKKFSTDAELIAHVNQIHALPSMNRRALPDPSLACRCEVCGRLFRTSSARTSHMNTHRSVSQRCFKCPLCDLAFHSPKLVPQHVASTHKINGRFTCSICDRTFDNWVGAQRHGRYYHAKSQYDCTICGRQFMRSDKLRNHMTSHSDARPWLCEICGARYKRKDKLKHHMKSHANDADKGTGKPTSSRAQLEEQQYLASEFRCELCMVGFKKRGVLVNHVATKHRSEDAYQVAPCLLKSIARPKLTFACTFCTKTYSARRKLKAHVEKHHGQPFEEVDSTVVYDGDVMEVKPYRCAHCPKEYLNKSHLLAHERRDHKQPSGADKDAASSSTAQMSEALKRTLARLKPIAPNVQSKKKKQIPAPVTVPSSDPSSTMKMGNNEDDLLSRAISIADVDLSLLMTPPHNPGAFLVRTPNPNDSQ